MLLRGGLGLGRGEGGVGLSGRFVELLANGWREERAGEKGVDGVKGFEVYLKISPMQLRRYENGYPCVV